jgi:phospholipase C
MMATIGAGQSKRRASSAKKKSGDVSSKRILKVRGGGNAKAGATKKAQGAAPVGLAFAAADATQDNLAKIEHIVVLVMENRSFDHMLGYLTLENGRTDVDGLTSSMSNSYQGKPYPARPLTKTAFGQKQDPCHDGDCVTEQLSNGNGGFVSNYARTHPGDPEVDLPMGYYNGAILPVYDHLARNFLICDRWFCSVDGATWPNRLYAVTGRADGSKKNKKIPLYNIASFVRQLDKKKVSWRWYSHDIATLRITDGNYRPPLHPNFKRFSFFDRRSTFGGNSFLEDAAAGKLAAVSWIDPNFVDVGFVGPSGSNDDHPPSDVMKGQELVLKLYNAVINSPQWEKTLLVVVYDEHGGFYDHVAPPPADDDSAAFRHYGARVPAFIVSPWVERGKASHVIFDHTSIIKTILLKFCRQADGSIPNMGARVTHANHLGGLLTLGAPRAATPAPAFQHLIERVASWRSETFRGQMLMQAAGEIAQPTELNELQEGIVKAKRLLRAQGLPEGQP